MDIRHRKTSMRTGPGPSTNPVCPYCQQAATLVTGQVVYPHRRDLWSKQFWLCPPCDAWVGCHGSSSNPLGRLADASLRAAKRQAHAAFDPIWREGLMSRTEAYAWLSRTLKIPGKECHIGMFSAETCQAVVEACADFAD